MQQNFDVLFTAMRIHISETTHRELLKAGIYHMTKRGDINVKVLQFSNRPEPTRKYNTPTNHFMISLFCKNNIQNYQVKKH